MAQTVSNLTNVLKDAWTSDRLAKQFFDENPVLDRMRQLQATTIGLQAQVPIHKSRNAGYTSVAAAGGSLNTAGQQGVDQALYTLVYHWHQIQLETAAIAQAQGGDTSVVVAKDFEIQQAIQDMKKQASRQLATAADGKVASCTTGGASTTVSLAVDSASAYGLQAITRGWLGVGSVIDIGTTSDTDVIVTADTVSAIDTTSTAPTITIATSVSTTASHFVYIANPNSATAANAEMNGLRNIVKTSGSLGGINSATAGNEYWKAAAEDSSTTTLSLNLLLNTSRAVRQNSGKRETYNVTGLKQEQAYYELLQNQVRFTSDQVSAGQSGRSVWNGMEIVALNDILDTDWFCLTIEDFVRISPKGLSQPTWATDVDGSNGSLQWSAGSTAFKNAVVFPMQIGVQRRNTHGALTGLTA